MKLCLIGLSFPEVTQSMSLKVILNQDCNLAISIFVPQIIMICIPLSLWWDKEVALHIRCPGNGNSYVENASANSGKGENTPKSLCLELHPLSLSNPDPELSFVSVGSPNGPEAECHHRPATSPGFWPARKPRQRQIISKERCQPWPLSLE